MKKIEYFYYLEDIALPSDVEKFVNDKKIKPLEYRNLKNITDDERNNKKNYVDISNLNIENLKKELY